MYRKLMVVVMVTLLVASISMTTGAQEKVQIELWNTYSIAEIRLFHELLDEYQELNPHVEIIVYEIPYEQRETRVPTAVETGETPDILRADYPYQFYLAGLQKSLALDPYLEGWDGLTDIPPAAWDLATFQGDIVAMPQALWTNAIFYNQRLFAEAGIEQFPDTWDELVEVAKKLTKDGQYGLALRGQGAAAWSQFENFLVQAGGNVFEDGNYTADGLVIDSPEAKEALQFFVDLVHEYEVAMPGVTGMAYQDVLDAFMSERVAMYNDGSWAIANFGIQAPDLDYSVAPWPTGPDGNLRSNFGMSFYMVFDDTEHPEETVELLKWLVSKENATRWTSTLDHHPPVRSSLYDLEQFAQPRFEAFQYADDEVLALVPKIPNFGAIQRIIYTEIEHALLGTKTADQALDDAAARIRRAMR